MGYGKQVGSMHHTGMHSRFMLLPQMYILATAHRGDFLLSNVFYLQKWSLADH